MAKDPRFNFYTDNWIGGTEGFTLEQEGAYLSLIIMQSKVGRFSKDQAIDKLMQKTRGNAAACAGLWQFLMPKFETDGNLFWSARLEKEIQKSENHSKAQSDRANKRWYKSGTDSGNAAACAQEMPVYGSGSGTNKITEEQFSEIFDSLTMDQIKTTFPDHDLINELNIFKLKVRGDPNKYQTRDSGGIKQAFIYQLGRSKSTKKAPKNLYKVQ